MDRNHTYKILDYFDEFKKQNPSAFIDLIIVANKIPRERRERLQCYGITFFEIPESFFLDSNSRVEMARNYNNGSKKINKIDSSDYAEEVLIQISGDSPTEFSQKPKKEGTVAYIAHEVLIDSPYRYTEKEFYEEVHFNRRGRKDLKIDTYSLKRLELVQKYGWGIHINKEQRIALVPCESDKYRSLLEDQWIKKTKAYRNAKQSNG